MNDDIKKLELKVTELENQLKSLSNPDIDPEDLKVFQKVALKIYPTSPQVCNCSPVSVTCYRPYPCILTSVREPELYNVEAFRKPFLCYECQPCWPCDPAYITELSSISERLNQLGKQVGNIQAKIGEIE